MVTNNRSARERVMRARVRRARPVVKGPVPSVKAFKTLDRIVRVERGHFKVSQI